MVDMQGGGETARPSLRARLAAEEQVQMVSFYVREQVFLLPVPVIVEVLRYMPLTRLPHGAAFYCRCCQFARQGYATAASGFIADHRPDKALYRKELYYCLWHRRYAVWPYYRQSHTMYMVSKDSISWNIEAQLGEGADFLCGLANIKERPLGIIDPELIVEKLIEV